MTKVIDMHRGRNAHHDKLTGWLRRAELLEDARRARAPFSAEDQAQAAANLHRLLERLAAEGLLKRDVVAEAGLERGPTDSTKRLDTITLPPGASEARRGRLAKKPNLYFEVAQAIGKLRDAPHAPYLCAIFEGCSFGTGIPFETEGEEARWSKLADQLRRMAASVVRNKDVSRYWRDVCRTHGVYDPIRDRMIVSNDMIDSLGSESGLAHCVEHPEDVGPIPSILIAERTYAPWQDNQIILRNGAHLGIRARVQTEVRIALAPAFSDGKIASLFEFRSRLDIEGQDGETILPGNRYSDGTRRDEEAAFVKIKGEWHEVAEFSMRNVPQAEFRPDGGGAASRAWEPVSAAQLRGIFGEEERPFEVLPLPPNPSWEDRIITRFREGTPAYRLSVQVLSGALEMALTDECRRLRRMLDDHRKAQAEAVARYEAAAEARWSAGDLE